ncbi:MAG: ATP-binding protein [Pseudomonadota bacterium]
MLTERVDEIEDLKKDFAHLARLSAGGSQADVRLFLGRLIRKYRTSMPEMATQIESYLKSEQTRSALSPLRRMQEQRNAAANISGEQEAAPLPIDSESRLSLIKVYDDLDGFIPPLLSARVQQRLDLVVRERENLPLLRENGISPTKTAIFVGKPGVGKTITARWLAYQLNRPLWVLDLTAVMSSLLGRTGNNLRTAIDYAKQHNAVLLLDEIDALAKRRSDESDVGELKRLVTVMLQEIEQWPDTGLLLAATNHPELIDPAIWRRFDAVIGFDDPDPGLIREAVIRFLARDAKTFQKYLDALTLVFRGLSFSSIETAINEIRRAHLLEGSTPQELVRRLVERCVEGLDRQAKLDLAVELAKSTDLSQHEISRLTSITRDTIRKYVGSPQKDKK